VYFPFRPRKAAQVAAYLLRLHGGRLNYTKLVKLLYFADRRALGERGFPITGDQFVSKSDGPTLENISKLIEGNALWTEYLSQPVGPDIYLAKREPETDSLSEWEIRLLHSVNLHYGSTDSRSLAAESRSLPEWKDPNTSVAVPIDFADILRLEKWTDAEIQEVQKDAEDLAFFDTLGSGKP
jgi:hypothetical protein